MTVSYTAKVATNYGLGGFLKLLLRWRGSVYKLVWFDLLVFLALYYILNMTYIFALNNTSKQYFKKVVQYCHDYSELIPVSFVLGFFVNLVYNRWWSQFKLIPFPDSISILVGTSIKGKDEKSRIFRRTIVRYVCVTLTMTLALISPKVKKRFPTLKHFVNAGLLSQEETDIIEQINDEYPGHEKYWVPLAWAANVTTRARHEGIIKEDTLMKSIVEGLNEFRDKCREMLDYDWISIPLVYTQVVTLAVYGYFLTTVIGHQFLGDSNDVSNTDLFIFTFPFLPILEFFFYMGWLKVAETLMNPYGDDDDDFEVMWMIDRNVQISYILVDKIHQHHPKLIKDAYWDIVAPTSLPFTIASQEYIPEYPEFSTKDVKVKHFEQDLIVPEYVSKTDPIIKNPGVKTWIRNGRIIRTRPSQELLPLNQILISTEPDSDETDSKIPSHHSDSDIQNNIPQSSNEGDFIILREARLKQHKEKMFKYIQLLKVKSDESQQIEYIDK